MEEGLNKDYITQEELEKATQKVLNSLSDRPRSYGILKIILNKAIQELDTVCFIKNFE